MEGDVVAITALMPVRDTPAWMLDQAIESIAGQSFRDFEFLIIDDGSREPATMECLAGWAALDQRIRIERPGGIGITRALNLGIAKARGEWIARQDADDWSERRRFEQQLALLRANPAIELCGTAAWMHQANGGALWRTRVARSGGEIRRAFGSANPFMHGSTIFRRQRAEAIGGYREQFASSQDYDFFWRFSECAEAANLGEALYHYRYSSAGVSARKAAEQARAHGAARILAAQRARGEEEDIEAAFARAAVECDELRAGLKQADHLLLAGEYRRAGKAYAGLLRSRPGSGLAWAKLARCGVFAGIPAAREFCFRG